MKAVAKRKGMSHEAARQTVQTQVRGKLLALLVDSPLLQLEELAVLTKMPPSYVRALTCSDEFKETLSRAIMAKHGAQILNVRSKMLSTATRAADVLLELLDQDGVTVPQKLEAIALSFGQVKDLVAPSEKRSPMGEQPSVNINITAETLERARTRHVERATTLDFEALPRAQPTTLQIENRSRRDRDD